MTESESTDACDVVIVDDDDLTLELFRRMLRNTKLQFQCFSSGDQALAYLSANSSRIIFVDERMPRMQGLELLQRLTSGAMNLKSRMYLCSAIQLSEETCAAAKLLGAATLTKDIYRDKQGLLNLIARP